MKKVGDWLLVVVDGPSEISDQPGAQRVGVVNKIIEPIFGGECAAQMTVVYWRELRQSPLRRGPLKRGFAPKAAFAARLGRATAYGVVLLADNDRDKKQDRLAKLRQGIDDEGASQRAAVGVAKEMLEAWLLADPKILAVPLPAGRSCEDLWGAKADPESNYPKHVLRRCVLSPRGWQPHDAIAQWRPERARAHAPSLDSFMIQLEALARRQFGD